MSIPEPAALPEAGPEQPPLSHWIAKLDRETQELSGEVMGPAYRFMSKSDLMDGLGIDGDDLLTLAAIGARLHLIAGNIDSRQPPKLKMVTRR